MQDQQTHESRELELFMQNTESIYLQSMEIVKRKMNDSDHDSKAEIVELCTASAEQYHREIKGTDYNFTPRSN